MKKKKIVAMCATVAIAALAIGGTLAFFTDQDSADNVFTVGDLNIELKETAAVMMGDENQTADKVEGNVDDGYTYSNLMPGNVVTKQPTITNIGDNPAYVRAVVTLNNARAINNSIDVVYEGKGWAADKVQAVYDEVFDGWGINYNPRPADHGENDARGIIENLSALPAGTGEFLKVDFTKVVDSNGNPHWIFGLLNQFKSKAEVDTEDSDGYEAYGEYDGYYTAGMEDDQIRYVYYIALDKGESVTLFNGLNVPADFDQNVGGIDQMAMFDKLSIDIDVDAIQQEGFANWWTAFEALEAAHPIGSDYATTYESVA